MACSTLMYCTTEWAWFLTVPREVLGVPTFETILDIVFLDPRTCYGLLLIIFILFSFVLISIPLPSTIATGGFFSLTTSTLVSTSWSIFCSLLVSFSPSQFAILFHTSPKCSDFCLYFCYFQRLCLYPWHRRSCSNVP